MKVSFSNLAWEPADDDRVADVLRAHHLSTVDIAPGRYRGRSAADIRSAWADRGFTIGALQSVCFGRPELSVFDTPDALLTHLASVATLATQLGASTLVFGSPANRRRGARSAAGVWGPAVTFLRRAGAIVADHGCLLTVEAAPVRYGGDFCVTTAEAASWVRDADHPAVRLQLDTGILAIDGSQELHAPLVGHIHVSEPGLGELRPDPDTAARVRARFPTFGVTVEMLPGPDPVAAVARSAAIAVASYGA